MLLAVKHTAIAALVALAVAATPAAPAHAWGQREQDVLKGVAAAVVIGAIINSAKNRPRQTAPVYSQPQYDPQYDPRYDDQYGDQYEPRYEPRHQPRATSIYQTPAARAFQSYSRSERRIIQKRLASYGYYRGGFDGSFGPGTYSAIVAYADDNGDADRLSSAGGSYAILDGLIY